MILKWYLNGSNMFKSCLQLWKTQLLDSDKYAITTGRLADWMGQSKFRQHSSFPLSKFLIHYMHLPIVLLQSFYWQVLTRASSSHLGDPIILLGSLPQQPLYGAGWGLVLQQCCLGDQQGVVHLVASKVEGGHTCKISGDSTQNLLMLPARPATSYAETGRNR